MKMFAERNPFIMGATGIGVTAIAIIAALNYDKLPFVDQSTEYSAYFAEAGGLIPLAPVQVSGFRVGQVDSIELDGPRVLVRFKVANDIHLGDRTEAAIKTKSLLGAKILEVIPRGDGRQSQPIAMDRTRSPYQLPDALGDLTTAISGLDTTQISDSLAELATTFSDTPPSLRLAIAGVSRFSQILGKRDAELRNLLSNANKATGVLAERSNQIVDLVKNSNALLAQLQTQRAALDQISGNLSAVALQIKGVIGDNRSTLQPALDKLNGALAMIDNHKAEVQKSIKGFTHYATSLGEAVSSGPFFSAYVANLLPGQFVQPFIDAAFSDLGLDPNVLAPSQRADPQLGQPGTPALPVPMPRTGQGGEPNLTLPDAITGKPGDPRYPYREPLPAPPPGGPPPGPPALGPPNQQPAMGQGVRQVPGLSAGDEG
ncbi:MAG: MCE family protein [Mycobacterium sp.]